jgi:hypothetical protein
MLESNAESLKNLSVGDNRQWHGIGTELKIFFFLIMNEDKGIMYLYRYYTCWNPARNVWFINTAQMVYSSG